MNTPGATPQPPELARRLLAALLDERDRASILNELHDEFDLRLQHHGAMAARRWYRLQVVRSLWPAVARRWLDPRSPDPDDSPGPRKDAHPMDSLMHDLRFALRSLMKNPGYTVIALSALALGIGASTALFGVVDALLISPLPYPAPDRLVVLWETDPTERAGNADTPAPGNFFDWQRQSSAFEALSAYVGDNLVLTGIDEPERLDGYRVTGGFFDALGVGAISGRTLQPSDDVPGADNVVVLSHALWRSRFGADPRVMDRSLILGGSPYRVVGIMPADFEFPAAGVDYWRPAAMDAEEAASRRAFYLNVVGRLRADRSLVAAAGELDTIAARLEAAYPDTNTGHRVLVQPLRDVVVGDLNRTLFGLVGAIGFVLAIACANVANLTLTRAAGRRGEIAVRAALGASRRRIGAQLLVESAFVAIGGGAAGLLVARYGTILLRGFLPETLPVTARIGIDARVFAFTAVTSLAAAVLFGFVPALRASRPDLAGVLNRANRGTADGRAARTRAVLATLELALAVTLLIGAGLLLRSFLALAYQDPGFDTARALTMRFDFSSRRYADLAAKHAFYDRIIAGAEALPGVESAALTTALPMTFSGGSTSVSADGGRRGDNDEPVFPLFRVVSPGYVRTMRIPLRGRGFAGSDREGAEPVVVVNEAFVRHHWPGESGLGKRVKLGRPDSGAPWLTIIGVAGDVRQFAMETAPRAEIYLPYTQSGDRGFFMPRDLVVRAATDPADLLAALRHVVWSIDPDMPLSAVATLEEVVAGSIAQRRFYALLVGAFAGAALLLAVIGVYGVMSQMVAQRTREIGVRMALGARAVDVHRMVLRQGGRMIALGVPLGVGGAVLVSRAIAGLLWETSPLDAATFAGVCVVVVVVALLAIAIPARRAVRVDPVRAIVSG